MSRLLRLDCVVPLSLILLGAVPVAAGVYRVMMLLSGGPVNHETERFFAFPISIAVHVLSTSMFVVLGALQFSGSLRRRGWHAMSGRLVWTSGLVTAVSGLWLTLVFPQGHHDGSWLFAVRLMVISGMLLCLLKGLQAVLRKNFDAHRDWMIRSYALAVGAGTQFFTHLPWLFFPESATEVTHTLCMAAGWGINFAVAEWIIYSPRPGQARQQSARSIRS